MSNVAVAAAAVAVFAVLFVGLLAYQPRAARRRARKAMSPPIAGATPGAGDQSGGSDVPRRSVMTNAAIAVIGAALSTAALTACTAGRRGGKSPAEASTGGEVIDAATAAAGVAVSLVEFRILPATLLVEPGARLVLNVTNDGTMRHDLRLATGQQTPMLVPGEKATLDAGTITAAFEGWCTVPGHRQMGMVATIDVGQGGAAADPMTTAMGTTGAAAVSADLSAPPPDGWAPIDAALPPAPDSKAHRVIWKVRDVKTAVAPNVTQTLWTFDGRVPGPVLRGAVGDRFEVTVINNTDMTHNVDFHAEYGPPAKVMTPIAPGGARVYSFVARHAGAWLYHCSIEPMIMHMANGMYGALVIDPPGLPPAESEYILVGSEFFFGPEGDVGSVEKMMADRPDTMVFNGYPFAYQHTPLTAAAGELTRIWVVNAGPSRSVSFHVIGAPFTTQYLNGAYLLKDGRSAGVDSGAAQTLPVDPGNGGFVELRFDQPGSYPFLTHVMADAHIGAAGTFTVTD